MNHEDEFYIGYLPKAPDSFSKYVNRVVFALILIIGVAAFIFAYFQQHYANGSFEFGNLTEIEGHLYKEPVPLLRAKLGVDINGLPIYKSILLVNYLKFGASKALNTYEAESGKSIQGKKLRLRGTLIYRNGVTLMELTEEENAIIEVLGEEGESVKPEVHLLGEVTLKGEIIDPKCYFGVMNPGEGKPHKSCAIRCIAGGISPVFVTENENRESNHLLLVGKDGSPINHKILSKVGRPVSITGTLEQFGDWLVLHTNPDQDIEGIGQIPETNSDLSDQKFICKHNRSLSTCMGKL